MKARIFIKKTTTKIILQIKKYNSVRACHIIEDNQKIRKKTVEDLGYTIIRQHSVRMAMPCTEDMMQYPVALW